MIEEQPMQNEGILNYIEKSASFYINKTLRVEDPKSLDTYIAEIV